MKYILVTGGVISGIGKGIIASSIGALLKACGTRVTCIKIDPYINIDAGTFSPYEHGEVYVLDDGGEVDLDLGNYERFLDVTLHRDNNITTGKIYQDVINRERRGDYLGRTVQVIPNITDRIMEWISDVAVKPVTEDGLQPELCIIELGGTIGDIEGGPFVKALAQFKFKVKKENFCCVHVSLIPEPRSTGEQKTKPTQASVRELRKLGLAPDLIVCRSENAITDDVIRKVSSHCRVQPDEVICIHDVESTYCVPILLEEQNLVEYFTNRLDIELNLKKPKMLMQKWRELVIRQENVTKKVTIALVGKYTHLKDSYVSVNKALQHAAVSCNAKLQIIYIEGEDLEDSMRKTSPCRFNAAWKKLCSCKGILVAGGFGSRGIEGKIAAAGYARKNNKPYLGVCLGLQCAVIEFCRNVLGLTEAASTEACPDTTCPVIIEMPEYHPGNLGGTMRLGRRKTLFKSSSVLRTLYGNPEYVRERHRHRWEVNVAYVPQMEKAGFKFVGHDKTSERMEIGELEGHPYFVGVQYHPEYLSRPLKPSPPYVGLILAAMGKLQTYIDRGCEMSSQESPVDNSDDDSDLPCLQNGEYHPLIDTSCSVRRWAEPKYKVPSKLMSSKTELISEEPIKSNMKYILVTGGVISGIGKGIIASSIGALLKACGTRVTCIKIDPYINIDAGTFSPYEHGEVYVLDDGGEVDLDLGNYERFLDVTLHRDNNITTGKIYQDVINRERRGDYLGRTVQVIPNITDRIMEWISDVAVKPVTEDGLQPELCIIELGGTIGDIEGMPFIEALSLLQFKVKKENFCCVHVSLVPGPKSIGEQKTKPTQASVCDLRELGLSPDLIVCRSEKAITDAVIKKISDICQVQLNEVIGIHDVSSTNYVPLLLEEQNLVGYLTDRLGLKIGSRKPKRLMQKWRTLVNRQENVTRSVTIALVGKYTHLEDSYVSINKALQHAAISCNAKLEILYIEGEDLEEGIKELKPCRYHNAWQKLCGCDGVLVAGGFGSRGIEGKIAAAGYARKNNKPYLGVCLGLQCAVIEFCRNVLGLAKAASTEACPDTTCPVIIEMPEYHPENLGGTMRLGRRKTLFKSSSSVLRTLYGNPEHVNERHRHRWEVNIAFVPPMEKAGFKFVGHDENCERMEIGELEGHPYFVGVQYHPEYLSRPLKPSPPYVGLILAAMGKLQTFIDRGCKMSPQGSPFESSDDESD